MPCYNAAGFISRTLDSLAAQTWTDFEILIGEDCSTDDTLKIVSAFADGRSDVIVVRRLHNLGWLKNSNDLMAKATGELMFFAFHDDVVDPTYVEVLVEALRSNPAAILSYCDVEVFEVNGTGKAHVFDRLSKLDGSLARGLAMAELPRNWWVPNRGVFRASAFQRIGGMKPNSQGEFGADWPWLLHLSMLGAFVRVPQLLCHKYYQKGSLSKNWAYSPLQWRVLRHAGMREIWQSEFGLAKRAIVAGYVGLQPARFLIRLPQRVGRWIKHRLGLPRRDRTP